MIFRDQSHRKDDQLDKPFTLLSKKHQYVPFNNADNHRRLSTPTKHYHVSVTGAGSHPADTAGTEGLGIQRRVCLVGRLRSGPGSDYAIGREDAQARRMGEVLIGT